MEKIGEFIYIFIPIFLIIIMIYIMYKEKDIIIELLNALNINANVDFGGESGE